MTRVFAIVVCLVVGCRRDDAARRDGPHTEPAAHPFAKYEGRWGIASSGPVPGEVDESDGHVALVEATVEVSMPKPAFVAAVHGTGLAFFAVDSVDRTHPAFVVSKGQGGDFGVVESVSPPTQYGPVSDSVRRACTFELTEVGGQPLRAREQGDGSLEVLLVAHPLSIAFAPDGTMSACKPVVRRRRLVTLRRVA